jgi:hypothetical protein
MRQAWLGLGFLAILTNSAVGQLPNAANFYAKSNSNTSKPIDTTHPAAPVPSTSSSITMSSILSKFNVPGLYLSKKIPAIPAPGQPPSPVAYKSMTYPNTFQPVAPIYGKPR